MNFNIIFIHDITNHWNRYTRYIQKSDCCHGKQYVAENTHFFIFLFRAILFVYIVYLVGNSNC